ncbi:MAG: hypothetical protein FH753_01390 [Firmicutes bacterium]|nr:hypothetical protein [Bacillota bacterium]
MRPSRTTLKSLVIWIFLCVYVILHEGGHSLVVYLFGGKVTYFNINLFDARMSYRGEFSNIQKSLLHIGGFLLQLLCEKPTASAVGWIASL